MELKFAVVNTIALAMLVTASAGFASQNKQESYNVARFISPVTGVILASICHHKKFIKPETKSNIVWGLAANAVTVALLKHPADPLPNEKIVVPCLITTALWFTPEIYAAVESRIWPETEKSGAKVESEETGTEVKKFLNQDVVTSK